MGGGERNAFKQSTLPPPLYLDNNSKKRLEYEYRLSCEQIQQKWNMNENWKGVTKALA